MLAGGYVVASGARKTNTNSMFDYPTLMDAWKRGETFAKAQALGNNPVYIKFYDDLATNAGFSDTDSTKIVHGVGTVTINEAVP